MASVRGATPALAVLWIGACEPSVDNQAVSVVSTEASDTLLEAQVIIEDHRIDYNNNRPHSAHGDLTPTEFADTWTAKHHHQPQAA